MFKILLVMLGLSVVYGDELNELIQKLDGNKLLKSQDYAIKATKSQYEHTKGLNLPKLDTKLTYIRLYDTPEIAIHLPSSTTWADTGTKNYYDGSITLTYPIFRGFSISNSIKKANIQTQIAILKKDDLKRNLKLKLVSLYGNLYSLKSLQKALQEAKKALQSSLNKAEGFYKVELIPKSELLNIQANFYKIKSDIIKTNSNIKIINNNINYLTSSYAKAINLPNIKLNKSNILNRVDILTLKKLLLIDKLDINLAKSSYYPQINFIASYEKFGDTLELNGDGYTNANQSYGGVEFKYNIFNGFSDKQNIQSAKSKYLAKKIFLDDYIQNAKIELQNEYLKLDTLKESLKWVSEELKASNEYLRLSLGRFNQQLISSDELNNAIAHNANTKAKRQQLKSEIFVQKYLINLKQ